MPRSRPPAPAFNIDALETAFRGFLKEATIISKDYGLVNLQLYDAQSYFLKELFGGLRNDIHWFVVGKGRQLGITTICGLLDCFFVGAIPGIQGAIVFDTQANKEKFRILLKGILERLPPSHQLPIRKHDREFIEFENSSSLDYLVAGVKKGSGTLGRSRALNYVHATEICSYGDPDAFEAFRDSFSDHFPARLYIFESTAKEPDLLGSDVFMDLWDEAIEDTVAKKAVFLGWWRKETNSYKTGTPLFRRYGYSEMSPEEEKLTTEVRRRYGHRITLEQWAWFRHRSDPRAKADFVSDNENRSLVVAREHPTTIEQLFVSTGATFVPAVYINEAIKRVQKPHLYKPYRFFYGEDITAVHVELLDNVTARFGLAQLRVWEEPVPGARYVLAADPAFSASEDSDFYVVTICRAFGDRLVQVAEFAERNMQDYQFTWTIAYLANMYGNCRIILEINGPGQAVLTEFRHLKTMMEAGRFSIVRPIDQMTDADFDHNRKFKTFLRGVGDYMYHRPDSFGGGYNAQWQMTGALRETILVQLRDQMMMGTLVIRSLECLQQLKKLRQQARSIQPEGRAKDDRAIALAMAVRCWIDWERAGLLAQGRLYEREMATPEQTIEDDSFNQYMGAAFRQTLAMKQYERQAALRLAARPAWRAGVWRGRR